MPFNKPNFKKRADSNFPVIARKNPTLSFMRESQ